MKTQRIGYQPIRTSKSSLILGVNYFLLIIGILLLVSCATPSTHFEITPKTLSNECVIWANQSANIDIIGNEVLITTY